MTKLLNQWHKNFVRQPRLKRELGFLALVFVLIVVCLLPLRHAGWPTNHEGLAFVDRTAIYADHLRHGDIFPLWSSSDAFNMGTPLPLYYHKAFYYVSSPLYTLTVHMKFSIVAAIGIFMLLGAYGMRAATALFTKRRVLRYAAPVALLLANYTFTDWLIRGAMAEFSAMMLIPWLMWWCIVLVQEKRFSLWIVPIFFALFNAHNITALFAMIPLALACGLFLASEHWAGIKRVWKPAALAFGLLVVLFAPQLIMQRLFLSDFNPAKITQAGFEASQNFHDPGKYFVDSTYTWLQNWRTYTVQIDLAIWATLALGMALLLVALVWRRSVCVRWVRANILTSTFLLLAVSLATMFLLQCRFSIPVYEHITLLQYLQFPWRLLAFMTPLGILLIMYVISRFEWRWPTRMFTLVWLAIFVILSPLTHHFQYVFIPQSLIGSINTIQPGGIGDAITGIGEYLPRVNQNGQAVDSLDLLARYKSMYVDMQQTAVLQGNCNIVSLPHSSFDTTTVQFRASCAQQSTVALPISYSRYEEVRDTSMHNALIPITHRNDDPRLIATLPQGDNMIIEVKLPTVPRVLSKLL